MRSRRPRLIRLGAAAVAAGLIALVVPGTAAPQFLNAMVDEVLKVTPIDLHEAARARRAGEVAPLPGHEAVDEQQEALF